MKIIEWKVWITVMKDEALSINEVDKTLEDPLGVISNKTKKLCSRLCVWGNFTECRKNKIF